MGWKIHYNPFGSFGLGRYKSDTVYKGFPHADGSGIVFITDPDRHRDDPG